MRLSLFTIGSRGDFQPFLALAIRLKQEGFEPRLVTHDLFEPLARRYGIDFYPIQSNPIALLHSPAGRAWVASGQNPIPLITNMIKLGKAAFAQLTEEVEPALVDSDGVIYSLFGVAAYHIAEKMGVPSMMAHLQPIMGRNSEFPAAGSPTWPTGIPGIASLYNRFSYRFVEQVLWQPYRRMIQQWRTDQLGLPPEPFFGPYNRLLADRHPVLYAYSEAVTPRPTNWPDWYCQTGYWYLPPPTTPHASHASHRSNWKPPADLVDFIENGTRPIYIGFGSMVDENSQGLTDLIIKATRLAGVRAILHTGWAGLAQKERPAHLFFCNGLPHDWLFPQMGAVVHHGGAGTTAAGLKAGVPNIVVPFFADQFYWGERVRELGCGPAPLPRKQLTAENFAEAIVATEKSEGMRARAADIGLKLQNENGTEKAVAFIRQQFGTH